MATIPIDLPSTGLEFLWQGAGTLKQSAGGAVCVDGDPIGEITDSSSNARSPSTATSGAKAVFREFVSGLNMRPGMEFSTDDVLTFSTVNEVLNSLTTFTLYIVAFCSSTAVQAWMSEGWTGGDASRYYFPRINSGAVGATGFIHRDNSGLGAIFNSANVSANDGNRHIYTYRRTSLTNYRTELDGTEIQNNTPASNAGTADSDQLSIGAFRRATTVNYVTGTIAMIAGYSTDNRDTRFASHGERTVTEIINDYYRRTTRRRRRAA